MNKYDIVVEFEGKQTEFESENCTHHYRGNMIFIRDDKLYIVNEHSVDEIDLSKPIRNLVITIVKGE